MKKLPLLCLLVALIPCLVWSQSQVIRRPVSAGGGGGHTNYTNDANCQGAWNFVGGSLSDLSGEGNTLTNIGTTTFSNASLPSGYSTGQYAIFNGTSQYLTRTDADLSANFPGKAQKTDFTIAMWAYETDAPAGDEGWMSEGIYDCFELTTGYSGGWGKLYLSVTDSDNQYAESVLRAISATTWIHIVYVFTGGTTSVKYWISTTSFGSVLSAQVDTLTNVNNIRDSFNNRGFFIGTGLYNGTTYRYFHGHIYQPIIFDRALSAAEAEEIYTYGITGQN